MKLEFVEFLLPQLELMQVLFFSLIFGTTFFLVWKVNRSATPQNWEKNWHNSKEIDNSGDLDAEHGSVHDISQAVATKPEQWAEVMPSILLVIGLLGTFLGLGVALNKASLILMDASVSGMDDAMSNLMAMMQGLGTKFKTSTWGIIAFLGVKFWASNKGFEEKRLRWTAQKMKRELDGSRIRIIERDNKAQDELVSGISMLGEKLCATLFKEFNEHRNALVKESIETRKIITLSIQTFRNELIVDRDLLQNYYSSQNNIFQRNQEILNEQKSIASESVEQIINTNQKLDSLVAANISNVDAVRAIMRGVSKDLSAAFQKEFSSQRVLIQRSQEILENQKDIASQALNQGVSMRKSLESFVSANSKNIDSMNLSSEKMAVSAEQVGQSAVELGAAVKGFEANVSEVMSVLKQDLKLTIDNMNDSFKSNMSDISTNLIGATNKISQAVEALSINVEKTMGEVENSIAKSLETQQKTQAVFGETSETLNTNVEGLTQLINQLCDDIKSGLRAVSESGRRMTSLDSRYQGVTESAEKISQRIEDLSSQVLDAVSRLKSPEVNVHLEPLLKSIENIRKSFESQEKNLKEQVTALHSQKIAYASNFDQVIVLLQDINKNLIKKDRANFQSLEVE